jgi:hypothetical protein
MKTATSLALVAVGAIFAFAIDRSPAWLNLQVVGWVLMAVGVAGAVIPRRGNGWRRRNIVVTNDDVAEPGPVDTELAEAAPATEPERRFVRVPPGRLLRARRPIVRPVSQVQRETIEEFIEE